MEHENQKPCKTQKELEEENKNPLAKNGTVQRSPPKNDLEDKKKEEKETLKGTPTNLKRTVQQRISWEDQGDLNNLEYAVKIIEELAAFVGTKNNVHNDIKIKITKARRALMGATKDWKALEAKTKRAKETAKPALETPTQRGRKDQTCHQTGNSRASAPKDR